MPAAELPALASVSGFFAAVTEDAVCTRVSTPIDDGRGVIINIAFTRRPYPYRLLAVARATDARKRFSTLPRTQLTRRREEV